MPRKKPASKPIKELKPLIKVRLDSRTTITIKDMDKFDFWKKRYPGAKVVDA